MRRGWLVPLAGLAACSPPDSESQVATHAIDCALDGAAGFAPDCTMERHEEGGEKLLILRHPDGSFRRFQLNVEGQGLVAADGAQAADVSVQGELVELRVGADRYRLPLAP